MKGQWLGRTTTGDQGFIVLNIDDIGSNWQGVAYLLPDDVTYVPSGCFFSIIPKSHEFSFSALINPVDRRSGMVTTWDRIPLKNPEGPRSTTVEVSGHLEGDNITLKARTNIGVVIEGQVARLPPSDVSTVEATTKAWPEYKTDVALLSNKNMLYRGQERNWKLRTSFHRHGRYDIARFAKQDIPKLHQRLSARTRHVFNLEIPVENGAFYNLVQHHGYPTPLLDWTYSPYVAAFFAFRKVPKIHTQDNLARVYVFDAERWKEDFQQLMILDTPFLHVSIMEFLAIDNERLIPQQGVTTITNIDDIEGYIKSQGAKNNYSYLKALDIPWSERNEVIRELSYMGITAGSMFPGLDGACEELREKFFDE